MLMYCCSLSMRPVASLCDVMIDQEGMNIRPKVSQSIDLLSDVIKRRQEGGGG